jgi:membrane-associated phospholipid phosphatase
MFKRIGFVLILSSLFISCLVFWHCFSGREAAFLWVNEHLSPSCGTAARVFSHVGETWGMVILLGICLFQHWKKGLLIGLGWFTGACYSWIFKLWLMKGAERPFAYFSKKNISLQLVNGVEVHRFNTFPSGHTLTAFSILFLAVLVFPKMKWPSQFLLFTAAALCGLSRIVLVQHWQADVAGGAVLGILAALSACRIVHFIPLDKSQSETLK